MPHVPPPKRHPYDQWSPDARALDVVGDKWTLLIVRDLAAGPRRFVELQRVLPGISTEQLRSRLNRMVADGMLTRRRYREVPPRVEYELTERAYALMPVIGEVARWGYDWVWSAPRAAERVDIGAIFRVAPGLIQPSPALNATVAVVVEGEEGQSYVLVAEEGKVKVQQSTPATTDATITGSKDAWVAAFSPDGDLGQLRIEGDRRLATQLLEGLALGTEQLARATHAA